MKRLLRLAACVAVSVVLGTTPAVANPLDITNISGTWQNQVGGTNVNGLGTSTVTWGNAVPADASGYSFVAAADIIGAVLGSPLFLGTFTHINQVIPIPNLSSVDLNLGFDTNGVPPAVGAVFAFDHNETPNTGAGSPIDDDIVTITTPAVNIPITVGTDVYFFNLLGFSKDGGNTFSNVFTSPEGGSNSAALYGRVTTRAVPEPVTLLLLGAAALGIASRGRGRSRA